MATLDHSACSKCGKVLQQAPVFEVEELVLCFACAYKAWRRATCYWGRLARGREKVEQLEEACKGAQGLLCFGAVLGIGFPIFLLIQEPRLPFWPCLIWEAVVIGGIRMSYVEIRKGLNRASSALAWLSQRREPEIRFRGSLERHLVGMQGFSAEQSIAGYVGPSDIDPEMQRLVFERDRYTCQVCGVVKTEAGLETYDVLYHEASNCVSRQIAVCVRCLRKVVGEMKDFKC